MTGIMLNLYTRVYYYHDIIYCFIFLHNYRAYYYAYVLICFSFFKCNKKRHLEKFIRCNKYFRSILLKEEREKKKINICFTFIIFFRSDELLIFTEFSLEQNQCKTSMTTNALLIITSNALCHVTNEIGATAVSSLSIFCEIYWTFYAICTLLPLLANIIIYPQKRIAR